MADVPGNLSFVSFVRQGLAASISRVDGSTSPTSSGTIVGIDVNFTSDTGGIKASPELTLVGPGDIVGLDGRVVVRVWPKADDNDAESGSLPVIEFDQADLPWRYTPAKANSSSQLTPWINLLVVEEGEAALQPPTPSVKQATLVFKDLSKLPDLTKAWAWAHTQFADQGLTAQAIASQIRGAPGLFTSRIVSPRVLAPNTSYLACLVPTFARGAMVGTGTDPGTTDALSLAWTSGTTSLTLPVYFYWRFQTGSVSGFSQLAHLIQGTPLPSDIGRRHMDVSSPGLGLPGASTATPPTLDAEGALQSLAAFTAGPSTWSSSDKSNWISKLRTFLNTPSLTVNGRPTKVVAPPLYARWYAAQKQLDAASGGSNPPWFFQLNSDPRARVAGGLGTTVIQDNQDALLASGWKQVGELRHINFQLKVAQLGREVATRIFERHITTGTSDTFWTLTGRLQAFGTCGTETMCQEFDASAVGRWLFDPFWRRLSRPRGPIGRFQGRASLPAGTTSNVVSRLNGNQHPAPEPGTPPGTFTAGLVSSSICFEGLTEADLALLEALGADLLLFWSLVIIYVARQLIVSQNGACFWHGLRMMRFGVALFEIGCSVGGTIPGDAALRMHWCEGIISATDIAGAAPAPNFVPAASIPTPIGTPPFTGAAGTSDDADAAAFRAVLIALLNGMQPTSTLPTPTAIGDLTTCKTQFVASLSPQTTVPARFTKRLSHPSLTWSPKDPIEPIFAPPGFGRPMYAPLAEVSKDWILPGINEVGRNTAAIAMTNRRFIEAYMAGLNDEMTRALQWNEFPVDQRGTYFQQFWDITGIVPPQVGTIDILPVASWGTTANLGGNGPSGGTEHIVLVIRAQLIQRYPNVIVYAIQGQTNGSSVGLGTTEKYPIFNALIGPDVAFYGFDIPVSDARGNPGWFFVLAEQPGEPKFAAASGTSPGVLTPPTGQTTAAMVANKLFLNPFRIAFHGSVLLPSS